MQKIPAGNDGMPYIVELDFENRQFVSLHEHLHLEKTYPETGKEREHALAGNTH